MSQDIEKLFAPNLDFLRDNDYAERDNSVLQDALIKAKKIAAENKKVPEPVQEPVHVEPEVKKEE